MLTQSTLWTRHHYNLNVTYLGGEREPEIGRDRERETTEDKERHRERQRRRDLEKQANADTGIDTDEDIQ